MKLPKGSRAVTAIGFSEDSSMISCADLSDDHNVYIFQISGPEPQMIKSHKGGRDKILHLCWNKSTKNPEFCTVGPNHIFFWNKIAGEKPKKGSNSLKDENNQPYKKLNYACTTYSSQDHAYTGGSKGEII